MTVCLLDVSVTDRTQPDASTNGVIRHASMKGDAAIQVLTADYGSCCLWVRSEEIEFVDEITPKSLEGVV
jgi:hypothetical protein